MSRSQRRAGRQVEDAERERCSTITAIGKELRNYGVDELVGDAIHDGISIAHFRERAMTRIRERDGRPSAEIRVTSRDRSGGGYSLVRAVQSLTDPAGFMRSAGFEREISQELQQRSNVKSSGLIVPMAALFGRMHIDLQKRGMLTSGAGGSSVDEYIDGAMFADVLRARSAVVALGARVLPGLSSDLAIPRKTAATTASWLTEVGPAASTDPTMDNVTLRPKRIGAYTDVSRQLVIQSSVDMESLIQRDLAETLLLEQDRVALFGTGAGNQPTGVASTVGIGSVVGGPNGLALAYTHILALESTVAGANAMLDIGACGYAINPATRAKLKRTAKITGEVSDPIMGDDLPDANGLAPLNGYRCAVSTQLPGNGTKGSGTNLSTVIFGDWSQLLIGQFGAGVELVVDPYTLASTGQVRITANLFCDIAVRHAESFAVMTDAITV